MPLSPRRFAPLAALATLLAAAGAHADDSCISHVSFVRLATADADSKLVEALAPHLRAELSARDVGVCVGPLDAPQPDVREAIAEILLHDDGHTVTITIRDLVTDKRVERALDLASLPPDTRLLAIATSVDELLRASWLETLLATPRGAAPAPVTRAVRASLPPPAPAPVPVVPPPRRIRAELGAAGILSVIPGLRTGVGLEATGALWLTPRFGGYARAGFTRGAKEDSLNGAIAADVLRGGVGAMVAVVPSGQRFGGRLEAGLDALRVSFRADPLDRASVRSAAAPAALDAALGARLWVDLGAVRALLGVAARYTLAPAVGTDETLQGAKIEVTGVKGLGFEATAGAAWAF